MLEFGENHVKYIHEFSVVEDGAIIGDDVKIGPFSSIGSDVVLENKVVIHENVSIKGDTTIGAGTEVFPFSTIGSPPQDLKFKGEKTKITIGTNCQIRENVTIHPGTKDGGFLTSVGHNCLLMVGVHIAHDCHVGNSVIMANCATLAGHVTIDDYSILGGLSAVLQFVRIGRNSMVCGMTGVRNDVPPYGMVVGNHAKICGINVIGLKRHGFQKDEINEIKNLYDFLFFQSFGTFKERLEKAVSLVKTKHGEKLLHFLSSHSKKNICQPIGK